MAFRAASFVFTVSLMWRIEALGISESPTQATVIGKMLGVNRQII